MIVFFSLFLIKRCFTNFFFAKTPFLSCFKRIFLFFIQTNSYYFFRFHFARLFVNLALGIPSIFYSFCQFGFISCVHKKHFVVAPDNFSIHIFLVREMHYVKSCTLKTLCVHFIVYEPTGMCL